MIVSTIFHQPREKAPEWGIYKIGDGITLCHMSECSHYPGYADHLFRHEGSFQLKLPQIRGVVGGIWPDLIELIKQEAAEPLKKYIAEL